MDGVFPLLQPSAASSTCCAIIFQDYKFESEMLNYRSECLEFQLESAWIGLGCRTTAVSEGCGSFVIKPDTLRFVQQCLRFNCGKLTACVGTKWLHIVCECFKWAASPSCLSEEAGCSVQIGPINLLALDLHIWDFFLFQSRVTAVHMQYLCFAPFFCSLLPPPWMEMWNPVWDLWIHISSILHQEE